MGAETGVKDPGVATGTFPDPLVSRLWFLAVLAAPWSVELPIGAAGWRLAVPQEPLLLFVLAMAVRIHGVRGIVRPIVAALGHPIVVVAAAGLTWTVCSAACSIAPVASFKVLAVRGLQASVYLVVGLGVLRTATLARTAALVGAVGLTPIAVWALVRAQVLDGGNAMHASAMPFFHNRLELTVIAAFWALAIVGSQGRRRRWWSRGASSVLVASVLVLRGRSAIVALAAGSVGRLLARLRFLPTGIVVAALLVLVVAGALAVDLVQWQGERADLFRPATALQPLWVAVEATGVTSDASVLERFNRWRCSLLMAADRPLMGFGPGTFEREYGVYQRDRDRTVWSTNDGDLGDAHSEPLGRLAEEGLPGLTLQFALLGVMLWTGFRVAASCGRPDVRRSAEAWTGAVTGLAGAGVFVCLSDLPGTGLAIWIAAAVLVRLDLETRRYSRDKGSPAR